MEFFRDTMSRLPVPNTVIFKAAVDNHKWNTIQPKFMQ